MIALLRPWTRLWDSNSTPRESSSLVWYSSIENMALSVPKKWRAEEV
jgi:hypothetical protein